MSFRAVLAALAIASCMASVAQAAQTVRYVYDALGRLTDVQMVSGPGSGITEKFRYDAAGNRLEYQAQRAVTLTVTGTLAALTPDGVTLTVNVSGTAPGGTVTFTENGVFLGMAPVINGRASITLEGFAIGSHSITASYSGDATHATQTLTFEVKVQDLSWLPIVLDLVLSD